MDTRVIDYIQTKYKPESLDPIFVTDNRYNIPLKIAHKLNKTLIYNFGEYDDNGYDNSHLYMKRVFNGDMHNSDANIKYMKTLNVKVDTVDDIDTMKHILDQRVCLSEKTDNVKELRKRVIGMVDKFFHGDIEPEGIKNLDMYNDKVSIEYQIGGVQIYSTYYKHIKATEYFIGIPYKAVLKIS